MMEEYRAIKGYEGLYEVSNFGNVKSLKRKGCKNDRLLKPGISVRYLSVQLFKNKIAVTYNVHKLLAIAFLNHIPDGYKIVVDHIDNNPLNNRLDNLQLITHRENIGKDLKGSSKYAGVSWSKSSKKWLARININGKNKHLGLFTSEIQAANYYQYELQRL